MRKRLSYISSEKLREPLASILQGHSASFKLNVVSTGHSSMGLTQEKRMKRLLMKSRSSLCGTIHSICTTNVKRLEDGLNFKLRFGQLTMKVGTRLLGTGSE